MRGPARVTTGKPPPAVQATRRQGPDGGDGAARSGRKATTSADIETAAGDGGKGPPSNHFEGADVARTENGMHPLREYKNVASEASERGQASAGPLQERTSMGPQRPAQD